MRSKTLAALLGAAMGLSLLALPARAQQPTNAPSATLPGPGLFTYRPMIRYDQFKDGPGGSGNEIERTRLMHHFMYGLAPEWGAFAMVSMVDRNTKNPSGDEGDTGLGDLELGVSYRLFRHDFGPIETFRAAAQVSTRLPTGSDAFSNDTVNPAVGINTTTIFGRHGLNTSGEYEFTTGETDTHIDPGDGLADHLMLTGSYLFRLWPATYAEGGNVAVYSQFELLGHAETNGDASLDTGLGVLIEAPRWAVECSVILPVAEDLQNRPENEFGLALGVRLLF